LDPSKLDSVGADRPVRPTPELPPAPSLPNGTDNLKLVARNTDICPRLTWVSGQKLPLPQPAVMPRAAISLTQGQKELDAGTSPKGVGGQAGGV
jgi:hypothetical protein